MHNNFEHATSSANQLSRSHKFSTNQHREYVTEGKSTIGFKQCFDNRLCYLLSLHTLPIWQLDLF